MGFEKLVHKNSEICLYTFYYVAGQFDPFRFFELSEILVNL